jgi:P27 family predicted phage terminase small subunit
MARPTKKTSELKFVAPSRHGDRLENVLKPHDTIPAPPDHFDNERAKMWYQVCATQIEFGLLQPGDYNFIQQYVEVWAQMEEARKMIDKNGLLMVQKNGIIKANPAAALFLQYNAQLCNMSNKLGMNPQARQAVKAGKKEPDAKPDDDLYP